jgi:hypothetical protein
MSTQTCNYTNCECIDCKAYRKENAIPEPDPNTAYNAEAIRLAEVLAKIDHEERYSAFCDESTWDALDQYAQEVAISSQMRAARAMVDELSKVAKDFHHAGWTNRGAYDHPAPGAKVGQLEYLLKQRGLIPAKPDTKKEDNA